MAVPADEFEHALRRLRGLAVIVSNESASGKDVTDEYVDLEMLARTEQVFEHLIARFQP